MAWIEQRRRGDGASRRGWSGGWVAPVTVPSRWRRSASATDAQNLARADGFKKMVDAAGQHWPEVWVKGEGFVRPKGEGNPLMAPPRFDVIGEEYVRQIVDLSPGQLKRYLGQLRVLAGIRVRGSLVFAKPVTAITEGDLKAWSVSRAHGVLTERRPTQLSVGDVRRNTRVLPAAKAATRLATGQY